MLKSAKKLASLCFESISKGKCHKSGVAGDEAKEVYYNNKSVLRRAHNSCKYCACFVIVVSQHIVDTRQMLYKYMILQKLCGHKPTSNTVGYSLGEVALTRQCSTPATTITCIGSLCK